MSKFLAACFILPALIHLLPLSGMLGASHLARLYGLNIEDPNLRILMQHRAVLFGLLGAFLLYAAFVPSVQWLALMGGLISVVSFMVLAKAIGGYNELIARVFKADVIALVSLLVAVGLKAAN